MSTSPQTTALLVAIVLAAGLWLIRAAWPKPIPGIPYDKKSAGRLFGDVPDALKYYGETRELIAFLEKKCRELQSPVIQVFMRPFARPWVVLMDGRESQDIMARRGREFDRSKFFGDLLVALFPYNQVTMPTNDQWRYNRRLMGDAMSPGFLNNVAAYKIHENTMHLVELWQQKKRIAPSCVVDVASDIKYCTVDTIWAATFGSAIGASKSQATYLSRQSPITPSLKSDTVVSIPEVGLPKEYNSLKAIAESSEIPMNSPLGRNHHWFAVNFYPHYRKAIAIRDGLVKPRLQQAWQTFKTVSSEEAEAHVKSVVDLIVERETNLAKKQGREPQQDSRVLSDELNGFLNAGFETTSSTVSWGLKYLTHYQEVQNELRQSLKEAFPGGQQPEAGEIAKATVPYLEAFIDEVLRHSSIIAANIRVATVDSNLLGYMIPKGTDVFMLTNGPSFKSPAMPIDETKRSTSSREFKADSDRWNARTDMGEFNPDRWLVKNDVTGKLEFDPRAAPMQQFGAGVRSCYGKKLAYLEMRVIYTLLLWNFELLPIPETLSDFKAKDVLTHQPQNVRVMLKGL